jgi:uncharacterized protein involved in exopolysaccharide biosynthesis
MQQRLLTGGRVLPAGPSFTPRGFLSVLFRRRRVFWATFFVLFIPIAIATLVLPGNYESETKVLVERQRADPVISSSLTRQETDAPTLSRLDEQDIDSEIDLLQSEDVLRKVVMDCGLWSGVPNWRRALPIPLPSKEQRIAKALLALRQDLMIEPPNKSNILTIRYHSRDPQQAARVLNAVSKYYLEKHLQVHRPAGSTEFFEQEVARNRQAVQEAEAKLNDFTQANGVVAADAEGGSTLQKLAEFDGTLQTTKAQISSTQQRIANLQSQLRVVPANITSRVKTSPVLLDSLKSSLYALELKRSELLTKYQPEYRAVKDVDKQIADTRAAMAQAEQSPTAERTTEQDPTYVWLNTELAKARAELVALRATESQTQRTVGTYRSRAMDLERLGHEQQELTRQAKAAEEAYVASLRKQNEAKMSEALDRSRIMNISIVEPPTVPILPTTLPMTKLMVGFCLSLFMATGMVFVVDYWDPSFRTPYEVETVLEVPVLATIPHPKSLNGKAYVIELPGKMAS